MRKRTAREEAITKIGGFLHNEFYENPFNDPSVLPGFEIKKLVLEKDVSNSRLMWTKISREDALIKIKNEHKILETQRRNIRRKIAKSQQYMELLS